jgi:hypothetical protein
LDHTSRSSASIDPAMNSVAHLADAIPLGDIKIKDNSVYIFDFDGVVASRNDDDIYKLSPTIEEIPLLSASAECFGIRCNGMEQRYQRHLLYQAAAWRLGLCIEPGPAFPQTLESGQRSQLFILTARSGWHAVERLRDFLDSSNIRPVEIYNVGRVKKDRQVQLICREFESKQIYYVEDSIAHLADAASIPVRNLNLVYVDPTLQPERAAIYLRQHFNETLNAAMSVVHDLETEYGQDRSRDQNSG